MKKEFESIYKNISPNVITTSGLIYQLNSIKIRNYICKVTKKKYPRQAGTLKKPAALAGSKLKRTTQSCGWNVYMQRY